MAVKIKTDFYKPVNEYKTTIFLCGASLDKEDKFRARILKLLSVDTPIFNNYDIILPEFLFADLLYDSKGNDLLSLENILAFSVDVIIIVPESAGSIAELGAFVNNAKLREKIVCILDRKYKKDRSFINKGPIELLKKTNKDAVLFADPGNLRNVISHLNPVVKEIKKTSTKSTDEINLLQLENFILPSIFLLEPVQQDTLEHLVKSVIKDTKNSYIAATSALSGLLKKRKIELSNEGFKLTISGLNTFTDLKKTSARIKNLDKTIAFDNLRLELFNMRFRNKILRL